MGRSVHSFTPAINCMLPVNADSSFVEDLKDNSKKHKTRLINAN